MDFQVYSYKVVEDSEGIVLKPFKGIPEATFGLCTQSEYIYNTYSF